MPTRNLRHRAVVVSERVPEAMKMWDDHGHRFAVSVVQSLVDLDVAVQRHPAVVVLDAAIPSRPGGFDAQDASMFLRRRATRVPVLVWFDATRSSQHMAESVGLEYQRRTDLLAGAVCPSPGCVSRASSRALDGHRWRDPHMTDNPMRLHQPVLYSEMQRATVVCDTLMGLAACPGSSWQELASLFGRNAEAMRTALNKTTRPTLVRLGWIPENVGLSRDRVVALVHRRYEYFEHYALKHRRQAAHLFG